MRSVEDVRELSRAPERTPPSAAEVRDHLLGQHALTDNRSSFDRGAVVQALVDECRIGDRVDQLEARADALLADPRVVPLLRTDDGPPAT